MRQYRMKARAIPLNEEVDVIVVGGGPAGCAAAAAAAREGAKTLLLERTGQLGGMGTGGLVPFWCGFVDDEKIIACGLAQRVLDACREGMRYVQTTLDRNPLALWAIDAELLKRVYDDLVTSAGADVLFHTALAAVEKDADQSVSALIASNKAGLSAWRAKVYVDCTGDADLCAWAGAEFHKGDGRGRMQPATHCFVITNIDEEAFRKGPDVYTTDPNSPVHQATTSDRYPHIIDPFCVHALIGPGTIGFNAGHIFGADGTDPASVSAALIDGRKKADEYHRLFSESLPAFANSFLAATGSVLGVRETRRVVGDYVLTIDDRRALRRFPDEICRNAFMVDVHYQKEEFERMAAAKEGFLEASQAAHRKRNVPLSKGESLGVPYRCLCPKDLRNVLVAGRTISTDRAINGAVRIMACCLNTGEAAGMAAAHAVQHASGDVHAVEVPQLRTRLKAEGAYLP